MLIWYKSFLAWKVKIFIFVFPGLLAWSGLVWTGCVMEGVRVFVVYGRKVLNIFTQGRCQSEKNIYLPRKYPLDLFYFIWIYEIILQIISGILEFIFNSFSNWDPPHPELIININNWSFSQWQYVGSLQIMSWN